MMVTEIICLTFHMVDSGIYNGKQCKWFVFYKYLFVIKERKVGYPIIVYSQVIPSCLSLSSLLFFPTFEIRLLILKKKNTDLLSYQKRNNFFKCWAKFMEEKSLKLNSSLEMWSFKKYWVLKKKINWLLWFKYDLLSVYSYKFKST